MFDEAPETNDTILIDANYEPQNNTIKAGDYLVRVTNFEQRTSPKSGLPQIVVAFIGIEEDATGIPFRRYYNLDSLGRNLLTKDFDILGVEKDQNNKFVVNAKNIVGKIAVARIVDSKPFTKSDGQVVLNSQIAFLKAPPANLDPAASLSFL